MLRNRVAEVKLVSVPFFYLDEKTVLFLALVHMRRGEETRRERERERILVFQLFIEGYVRASLVHTR